MKKENLLKLKKNIITLGLISSSLFLTSCGNTSDIESNDDYEVSDDYDTIEDYSEYNYNLVFGNVNDGDVKEFERGQHYIYIVINSDFNSGAINDIPDGYRIYTISTDEYHNNCVVWFVNTEKVSVRASSYDGDNYGYYTFGEIVEPTDPIGKLKKYM